MKKHQYNLITALITCFKISSLPISNTVAGFLPPHGPRSTATTPHISSILQQKQTIITPRSQHHQSLSSKTHLQQSTRRRQTSSSNNNVASSSSVTTTSSSQQQRQIPSPLPKVIVFDLDNTLWTPELYQIRDSTPQANVNIQLFSDVPSILSTISHHSSTTSLAIASRTSRTSIAHSLLDQFTIKSQKLSSFFPHVHIYEGSKVDHFSRIAADTGVPCSEMLFFDDDAWMNCREVSKELGVFCCHTPKGLTGELFYGALEAYAAAAASEERREGGGGVVVTARSMGLVTGGDEENEEGRVEKGFVKFYSEAKRFGFVRGEDGKEYFLHESKIPDGVTVRTGSTVEFMTLKDGKGRLAAAVLSATEEGTKQQKMTTRRDDYNSRSSINNERRHRGAPSPSTTTTTNEEMIEMPCFSMSQPFTSLLLNKIKTIETRNNPMFMDVKPGTKLLLHCGMRDWRDQDDYRHQLQNAGFDDADIQKMSALPSHATHQRGQVVGVLEVGRTWASFDRERRGEVMQRRVVASYENVGKYATEITGAWWLKRGVRMRGNRGIFRVNVPKSCLPDGWEE